jgi:hypothetical protein
MKREDIALLGYDPAVVSYPNKPDLIGIYCKLIEPIPGEKKARRTDKLLRLGLTIQDAMKLLRLLQRLQNDLGLSPEDRPSTTVVIPPKGRRH